MTNTMKTNKKPISKAKANSKANMQKNIYNRKASNSIIESNIDKADKIVSDKIKETVDMYHKLNSENQSTAFLVIQSMLTSQKNTEAAFEKAQKEN